MYNLWCTIYIEIYSTERTQPNTKADPESGPEVRFGSASSPLFKNLRPFGSARGLLWVRSGSARGSLCVHSWWGIRFVHSCVKRTPLCCYLLWAPPLVFSKNTVQQTVHYQVENRSITTCRTVKRFHGETSTKSQEWERNVNLSVNQLNNSKIRDTILTEDSVHWLIFTFFWGHLLNIQVRIFFTR